MLDQPKVFRMDFEFIAFDKDSKMVVSRPDSKRYEQRKIDGKEYLYDKFEEVLIGRDILEKIAKQLQTYPLTLIKKGIDDAEEYVESRIPIIHSILNSNKEHVWEDKSEEFLKSLSTNQTGFVFMCVDIVGSTKLSISLPQEKNGKLRSTALHEMAEIIPKFRGYVLKYMGDGLIAYFPEPNLLRKNDLAIDCALTIRRLVYSGLNQVLKKNGYPKIDIRVGLDSGDGFVQTMGSKMDIDSTMLDFAAKIQHLGEPGDIILGESSLRNLHADWRELCEELPEKENWKYQKSDGQPYKIYKLNFN